MDSVAQLSRFSPAVKHVNLTPLPNKNEVKPHDTSVLQTQNLTNLIIQLRVVIHILG